MSISRAKGLKSKLCTALMTPNTTGNDCIMTQQLNTTVLHSNVYFELVIGIKQVTFRFLQRKQLPRSTADFKVTICSCSLFTLLASRAAGWMDGCLATSNSAAAQTNSVHGRRNLRTVSG